MHEKDKEHVRLVGKYCETGDILADNVLLPECSTGDLIAMPVSGAYGMSMSSNYNLNPRPAVIIVAHGNSKVIRRRETTGWDMSLYSQRLPARHIYSDKHWSLEQLESIIPAALAKPDTDLTVHTRQSIN